jgi:hypothetical protein
MPRVFATRRGLTGGNNAASMDIGNFPEPIILGSDFPTRVTRQSSGLYWNTRAAEHLCQADHLGDAVSAKW